MRVKCISLLLLCAWSTNALAETATSTEPPITEGTTPAQGPPPAALPAPSTPPSSPVKADTSKAPIPPPREDAPTMWIDRNMTKSWELGGPRLFFSTMIDVGYLYLRPRVAVGYGKPFHKWIGLEANPAISGQATNAYAGLRIDLPNFDIRVGGRQTYSFNRSYQAPRVKYDRYDLESTEKARSFITTLETEANFSIPIGPGIVIGLASLSYIPKVPDGDLVYEETLRVMVQPPWVARQRVGYMFGFGEHRQASIGPAIDVLEIPERRSVVMRAGILTRFVLSRSFELRGTFMPRIISQDALGLLESDFTELGLRWRWATASP